MNRDLQLTDEEFQELDLLVKQALDGSRVELNHTVTFAYKDRVKQRIHILEQIVARMEHHSVFEERPLELRDRAAA